MPFSTEPVPATTRIDARTVPMHGAAQTANAPPSSTLDPRRRAPVSSPGASILSVQGSTPMNVSPMTTSTKPASSAWLSAGSTLPIAAAPAPRSTKTTVNPAMKGRLANATRRAAPGCPSRSASIAETADR